MPSLVFRVRPVAAIAAGMAVLLAPYAIAPSAGAAVAPTQSAGLTACLGQSPSTAVRGAQVTDFRPSMGTATAVDATTASWHTTSAAPVTISGTGGVCWTGGVIESAYAASTPWATVAATTAFSVANPSATVDNLRVHGYGDGVRVGADDFLVRGAFETAIRQACVADDHLHGGVVAQSLFDGCGVGFSARRPASDTTADGSGRWVSLTGSLLRLRAVPAARRGAAPAPAGFFDWDRTAPGLDLQANVFRADQATHAAALGLPATVPVTCSGNVVVWTGKGAFPGAASWLARCPDTRIVTTATTWSGAVAQWKRARTTTGAGGVSAPTTTTTTTTAPPTTTTTTTTTAPPTTTTTTTTTPTTPGGPVGASATCLTPSAKLVTGTQTTRYKPVLTAATAVDARSASWVQVDDWPVSITGTAPLCWHGGTITGTYPDTTPWTTFHSTGAFNVANPDSVVESVRIHDYGDGIRLREGATHWTVRDADESYLHDDCVENDRLYTGAITDSLFDGCYVAFSARPESSDTTSDGRTHTMSIDRSLVRLQPMPTVYKGPAPGTGGFFKWDDTARSPALDLHDNVFRADQLPNHGSLGLPDGYGVSCSGNVIVWLGSGPFPEAASWKAKCPDTIIVTDRSYWDAAVAGWRAAH